MNTKQKIILFIGLTCFIAMFLYPPWVMHIKGTVLNEGYEFIFNSSNKFYVINYNRIFFQSFVLIIIIVFSVILFSKKHDDYPERTINDSIEEENVGGGVSIKQESDGRHTIKMSDKASFSGLLGATFTIFSQTLTKEQKDIFNIWAGLQKGEWSIEHRKHFNIALMNHLYDGKLGKVSLPPVLQTNANLLNEKPPEPINPLTKDIRDLFNSLFL